MNLMKVTILAIFFAAIQQISAMQVPPRPQQPTLPQVQFNTPEGVIVNIYQKLAVVNPSLKNVNIKGAAFDAVVQKLDGTPLRVFSLNELLTIKTIDITKDEATGLYNINVIPK